MASRQILEDIHPSTVRGVCYQLFTRKLIGSMSVKDVRTVQRLLVMARERGSIPWDHIVGIHGVEFPAIGAVMPLEPGISRVAALFLDAEGWKTG